MESDTIAATLGLLKNERIDAITGRPVTWAGISQATGIPLDRLRNLAKGNVRMAADEACLLARYFDVDFSLLALPGAGLDAVRRYARDHAGELDAIGCLLYAVQCLGSLQRCEGSWRPGMERDRYHDGMFDGTYRQAYVEEALYGVIENSAQALTDCGSGLLSGVLHDDALGIVKVLDRHRRRWWSADRRPFRGVDMIGHRGGVAAVWRVVSNYEACKDDEPPTPELLGKERDVVLRENADLLALCGCAGQPVGYEQARRMYDELLIQSWERSFTETQRRLRSLSHNTPPFRDSGVLWRIKALQAVKAIVLTADDVMGRALGMTPVVRGYDAASPTTDTELARMLIEKRELHWSFGPGGLIMAANHVHVVAYSLAELSAKFRKAGFLAGNYGVHWNRIPSDEAELIELLDSTPVIPHITHL